MEPVETLIYQIEGEVKRISNYPMYHNYMDRVPISKNLYEKLMTYKFQERTNYGLCNLNFKEKPYCNQMCGLFDETIRFCDVCGGRWKNVDGEWVTVKEPKLQE